MQSTVILYMAMTANGFIATNDDDTPWSDAVWNGYYELVKKYGNIVVGKRTYEFMQESDEFKKLGFPETVVVSTSSPQEQGKVNFVDSPRKSVEVLEQKGFQEIIVGGGSATNASFLKDGLIDEIVLDIDPLLFGTGIPLFAPAEIPTVRLEVKEVSQLSKNTLRVIYKVLK